jgi:hypothetical protein
MALSDPRSGVSFSEIGRRVVSFFRDGSIDYLKSASNLYPARTTTQQGYSVSMTATNGTVKVGADGDMLLGVVDRSEIDSKVGVQIGGAATIKYTAGATAPLLGRGVVCDGTGGVRIAAADSEWKEVGIVVSKDTTALTVVVFLPYAF